MSTHTLFYVTNRKAKGSAARPTGYGKSFSDSGSENLRFGRVKVTADDEAVRKRMKRDTQTKSGDKSELGDYFKARVKRAAILPYAEKLDFDRPDHGQELHRFGSEAMFWDLHAQMTRGADVLVYVHGFNVSWEDAVGAALALQVMANRKVKGSEKKKLSVILFTWPSDGTRIPFYSYASDRSDGKTSGYALGRAILKVRDFLVRLRAHAHNGVEICSHEVHLLCHSMGNYVFQKGLKRLAQHTPTRSLPRILGNVFLCAPDVDDDVLEEGKPFEVIHEVAREVTVYHNRGDVAMKFSDSTKGNPERLGAAGAARPSKLHHKIHQVDCTGAVTGKVQHSYYLTGRPNADIRLTLNALPAESGARNRKSKTPPNVWTLK